MVYYLKTTLSKALFVMFSGQTALIETYDIPINSDFDGERPCKMWALGIDRVFSSTTIYLLISTKKPALTLLFLVYEVLYTIE